MLDLSLLLKTIWIQKKVIIKSTIYALILGFIIAYGSKVEYNSSIKLIPNEKDDFRANLGGLSGLAGLAGINLNTASQDVINPEIYPEITESVPFLLEILNKEVYFSTADTLVSTFHYLKNIDRPSILEYIRKYTIALPFTIKKFLSPEKTSLESLNENNKIIVLSKEDTKLIEKFKERIITNYDSETGVLMISVIMPDANAAAEIADLSFRVLQEFLIDFKSEKAKEDLDFIQERYDESKTRYKELQSELASYTDQNQNVRLARAQIELQNIQNEYDLAYELYKSLANQLEQAKIKVKEDSPVLSVIDPPRVPVEKSSPKRLLILIVFTFLGCIGGLSLIIFDEPLKTWISSLRDS